MIPVSCSERFHKTVQRIAARQNLHSLLSKAQSLTFKIRLWELAWIQKHLHQVCCIKVLKLTDCTIIFLQLIILYFHDQLFYYTKFSVKLGWRQWYTYKIQKHFQNVILAGMASKISKNYTYKCVDRSRHSRIKGAKAKYAH